MSSGDRQWWRRYDRYLNIQGWQLVREACFRRNGYRCRQCGLQGSLWNPLQADHLTYQKCERMDTHRRSQNALPSLNQQPGIDQHRQVELQLMATSDLPDDHRRIPLHPRSQQPGFDCIEKDPVEEKPIRLR
jgi:hypothetical protein